VTLSTAPLDVLLGIDMAFAFVDLHVRQTGIAVGDRRRRIAAK